MQKIVSSIAKYLLNFWYYWFWFINNINGKEKIKYNKSIQQFCLDNNKQSCIRKPIWTNWEYIWYPTNYYWSDSIENQYKIMDWINENNSKRNYIEKMYDAYNKTLASQKKDVYKNSLLNISNWLNEKYYDKSRKNNSENLYFNNNKIISWILWNLIIPEKEIIRNWELIN